METALASSTPNRRALWVGRVLSALPILALLASAAMKIAHPPKFLEGYSAHYGYPASSATFVGIAELIGVVLYAVPQTTVFGAIWITGFLGGAVATHVHAGEPFFAPLVVAVVVWAGLFLREPRLSALFPIRRPPV